jgi:hypothetical protein
VIAQRGAPIRSASLLQRTLEQANERAPCKRSRANARRAANRTVGAGRLGADVEQHAVAVVGCAVVREPRRGDADTSAERARSRLLDAAPRDLSAAQRSPLAGQRAVERGELRVGDQRCQIGALDVREPRQRRALLRRPLHIASERQQALAQRHTRHIHCQGGSVLLHVGAEAIEQHDGARLVAVHQRSQTQRGTRRRRPIGHALCSARRWRTAATR